MFQKLLFVILLLGITIISSAFFQNADDISDTISIAEIKVSAVIFEGELKTMPASVSVLTDTQLKQYNELEIVNSLNSMPGIFMQSGTFNTNRIVIRGIGSRTPYSSNRIKAYLNDIPLTNGDGVTTIEDIDVNRIGRVEVMKGPSSAIYGAGLGGTLKLTTNQLDRPINVGYQLSSFNTNKLNVSLGFNIPDGNISTSFHRTHSDGFRENNKYNRNSILLSTNKQLKSTTLNFTVIFVDMNAQIPSSLNFETYTNSPEKAATNWLGSEGYEESVSLISGVTINHRFSEEISNKTTVFFGFNKAFEHRPFNDLDDNSMSYGARSQIFYKNTNWELIAGVELFSEIYSWRILSMSDKSSEIVNEIEENRSYSNLFSLVNYQANERLLFSVALNLNRLNYSYNGLLNDYGRHGYPFILSPRLGVNYEISSDLNLYGSLGHGFSSPSLEETLRPDGKKNPDLKQEQGLMGETGARISTFKNRLFFDVVVYQISLTDLLITKRITEDIFTGINAGKTKHRGLEVQSNLLVFNNRTFSRKLSLNAALTLSFNHFVEFEDNGISYNGKYLPGIPNYIVNAGIQWQPFSNLNLYLNYRNVGEQFLTDSNIGIAKGYQLLDCKFNYELVMWNKFNVNLSGGINNSLNTHYSSMILINAPSFGGGEPRYYYPGKPRNIYVSINFIF